MKSRWSAKELRAILPPAQLKAEYQTHVYAYLEPGTIKLHLQTGLGAEPAIIHLNDRQAILQFIDALTRRYNHLINLGNTAAAQVPPLKKAIGVGK